MNRNEIRREIDKLAELVDGWESSAEVPALERDLALEQLRRLYELIRFCPIAAAPAFEAPGPAVLPANPSTPAERPTPAESPMPAEPPKSAESPAATSERTEVPAPEAPMPTSEDLEMPAVPEIVNLSELLTLSTEPVRPEEPAAEAAMPAAETPMPAAVPTPAPESSAPTTADTISPTTPLAEPAVPQFVSETDAASAGISTPSAPISASATPTTSATPTPATPVSQAPDITPEPAVSEPASGNGAPHESRPAKTAPTLFGMEETARHRHKQRVIMSLYDTPAESETPARESASLRSDASRTVPTSSMTFGLDLSGGSEPSATQKEEPKPSASATSGYAAPHRTAAEPHGAEPTPASGTVLGEVINHDVQTLADTIARPRDVASELRRQEPVGDLRRAIGINDKFLLIRDLFNGDGKAYEQAIDSLNGCADLDDCMIFIAEHYAWNPDSDGARLLMELLERKFS